MGSHSATQSSPGDWACDGGSVFRCRIWQICVVRGILKGALGDLPQVLPIHIRRNADYVAAFGEAAPLAIVSTKTANVTIYHSEIDGKVVVAEDWKRCNGFSGFSSSSVRLEARSITISHTTFAEVFRPESCLFLPDNLRSCMNAVVELFAREDSVIRITTDWLSATAESAHEPEMVGLAPIYRFANATQTIYL